MRIVSLVPAGTDILCGLGLGSDIVGISHECDGPAGVPPPRHAVGDAAVYIAAGGRYFTRPGPHLVTGIEVLASVFHPDIVDWSMPTDVIAPWP